MSGEGEHDEPRESASAGREASPAPSDRGSYLPRALMIAGIVGVGLLLGGGVIYRNFIGYIVETREDYAHANIHTIETALVGYQARHGDYPPSLQVLAAPADGKPAYLLNDELIDPWGTQYRYDPLERHPKTGRPKVFTVTPKGAVISNW
jgi:Type II secretion system (T2SS), protein G